VAEIAALTASTDQEPHVSHLASLAPLGFSVLPQSHLVPVDVWLREASGSVLHLSGRGTTLRLRSYDASDLTAVLLRSECDCRAHREAGAAHRVALSPGARPVSEAAYDGAARHGWTGVEAAVLRGEALAAVLRELLALVGPVAEVEPVETTLAV
jgi:hypothetical protein